MEENLIKVVPNKEKAKSILKMVDTTLELIKTIDADRFPSNFIKEYYEVIRELMSVILLLDGYKTYGEGAHKVLVDYLGSNYKQFSSYDILLINNLRITRNRIAYDGFFVETDYVKRNLKLIESVVGKLSDIVILKLKGDK